MSTDDRNDADVDVLSVVECALNIRHKRSPSLATWSRRRRQTAAQPLGLIKNRCLTTLLFAYMTISDYHDIK